MDVMDVMDVGELCSGSEHMEGRYGLSKDVPSNDSARVSGSGD
jgi:hypothetical protein